jgi:hypothetical protein
MSVLFILSLGLLSAAVLVDCSPLKLRSSGCPNHQLRTAIRSHPVSTEEEAFTVLLFCANFDASYENICLLFLLNTHNLIELLTIEVEVQRLPEAPGKDDAERHHQHAYLRAAACIPTGRKRQDCTAVSVALV